MAEWENDVPLDPRTKKKKGKPRTASAYGRAVNKENNISNIVRVVMFRQRLASKHYRLRDSELAEWRSASGRRQK